ncbi:NAD(P)H-hydrate dehydratase [Ramlibacter ginsenosidimutans]|uniref:ADP-dependent (S)-NAD(P)H-hydrate dehydratase n=1 Tax=Ramlibacter ginsenosidimutans TaxID=502333 RepID=A0A934TRA4_9BURK|nr:NAD(P)H-hydrate dehydratase [Ramlibacter ginsenosidimutans]MBK6006071.1 NAD(P)H-hydrate dehydratase [Ramlibacter ginsenosidimutans]
MNAASREGEVDDALLRAWPLPVPDADGDKESRGRVLVVAGSREMPGAAVLAATAALRAGAGKLVIATPASVAQGVALAMPEARVIALPEGSDGSPTIAGLPALQALASATACLLVGPGMIGEVGTPRFVEALLPLFRASTVLLDALAMDVVRSLRRFAQPVLLTPHAGEMAHLTGRDKEDLQAQPRDIAVREAAAWNAVLALKGPTTCIATADGRAWLHRAEAPGLGTSGSGDVLSGIIAGLAARGAAPEQAAVWGVALHARAGEALARRIGRVGYLARELSAQVPALMNALAPADLADLADLADQETARPRAAPVA